METGKCMAFSQPRKSYWERWIDFVESGPLVSCRSEVPPLLARPAICNLRGRRLAVFPVGFALFAEGAEALLGIFQAIEFVEEDVHGIAEPAAERGAHATEDGFLGHGGHRAGGACGAPSAGVPV